MSDIVELLRKWHTTESMRRSTASLIAEAANEIERLVDELATTIVLADDLYETLDSIAIPDPGDWPKVERAKARYREARGR